MTSNRFLPPPVSLHQASEGEVSGGGGVTRRSFIKRTGGATVAAFVAWNSLSSRAAASETDNASATGSGSGSWLLICQDEPAANSYKNASPDTLNQAIRKTLSFDTPTLDQHGEGIMYKLVHWLDLHSYPQRKDSAAVPGGELKGQATAHMAILKGYWTYRNHQYDPVVHQYIDPNGGYTGASYSKLAYVWTTECHLTAGGGTSADEEFKVTTTGDGEDAELVYNNMSDNSNKNGPQVVKLGSRTLGWALVSIAVEDFSLRSDAVFVPRSYLQSEDENFEWNFNVNVSTEIGKAGEGGAGGGVGGGWSSSYGINQEPPSSPITLDWTFVIRESTDGIDEPTDWSGPNPGVQLP